MSARAERMLMRGGRGRGKCRGALAGAFEGAAVSFDKVGAQEAHVKTR